MRTVADSVLLKLAGQSVSSTLGIPEHLLQESLADPWISQPAPTDMVAEPPVPIVHEDEVVGFHLPAKHPQTGQPFTGDIFISKEHRRKGLGTETLSRYLESHPAVMSYVHKDNEASKATHRKAGFEDTGVPGETNADATIWRKKGYNDALDKVGVAPMSAHEYRAGHVTMPVDVQPKLDGIRALAQWNPGKTRVLLAGRGGTNYDVPHVQAALEKVLPRHMVLDGELYIPGKNFQSIVSKVKGSKSDKSDLEFHFYDGFERGKQSEPWKKRKALLDTIPESATLRKVPTRTANEQSEIDYYKKHFEREGYEGAIVRGMHHPYAPGERSTGLLKYKTFKDEEFKIVGFDKATGAHEGAIVWKVQTPEGREFRATPSMTIPERQRLYKTVSKNPGAYVGEALKVKFQGKTEDGIPRFPIALGVRPKEDIQKVALSLGKIEAARQLRFNDIYKGLTGRPYSQFVGSTNPTKVRDLLDVMVRLERQAPLSSKVLSGAGIVEHGHGVPANLTSRQLAALARGGVEDVGYAYV